MGKPTSTTFSTRWDLFVT